MTGDYDLMSVCPTWNDYRNRTKTSIFKPGVNFIGKGVGPAARFSAGTNLDAVLDMGTNTGARGPVGRSGTRWRTWSGISPTGTGDRQVIA